MSDADIVSMSISNLITKASRVVGQHYQRECAPLRITPSQAGIVWVLSLVGPRSQVEIASLLHLEKTNINAMVKKLQTAGLVTVQKTAEDARRTEVALTQKGNALSKKLYRVDERVNDIITSMVGSERDAKVIRRFLEKIVFAK
ncbi:MAG: winged helix-turn-helix transcriptional regulator [Deltaproteobacteria bacterium]|nr:winged helix-turn-helix transcriptional regulator [Deltaproteobacteria bacterium]MBN2674069.1 winged helix-turn-helix transcriptional regulator [Deltaproteobacteria bacterium]